MINILEHVVLYCLSKLGNERTSSAVFHLINGKKSSQTIQDSHFFQLDSFFHVVPHITREQYDNILANLTYKGLITADHNQSFLLTDKGEKQAGQLFTLYPYLEKLQGGKYHNSLQYWEKISLLVQVCSNLVNNETSYIPVQKNKETQIWIKRLFVNSKGFSKEFPSMLLKELKTLLLVIEKDINPTVLVARLTGFQRVGLTEKQTMNLLNMEENMYRLQFQAVLHSMLCLIETTPSRFPLLYQISNTDELQQLTTSARKTYEWLQKGKGITEIGRIRKLKESTIQDHIVEIALCVPAFSIDHFVDSFKQEQIKGAIQKASSKQLRRIREFVDVDYFQIRLVIAKLGESL